MNITILTDFWNHDPAYSLCGVVANQAKMLALGGHEIQVLVRGDPLEFTEYHVNRIHQLDPGEVGSNKVNITDKSDAEIENLTNQLRIALTDQDFVFTHDMIYQPNMWKYHVAARRVQKDLPELKWLHWVHSTTPMNVADKTGRFKGELRGKMNNSKLVIMTHEEAMRKAGAFGYEIDEVVYIPNPIDLMEGYHEVAVNALKSVGAYKADILFTFPTRLDRGKQIEWIVEVAGGLKTLGLDARVIIIDFHSTSGDKVDYRMEVQKLAMDLKVPCIFTSQLNDDTNYHIPHKAVMDIFEYSDVLLHASRSECDPLILPEALWKRNLTVLNFDLPMFRQYVDVSIVNHKTKFSSNIDALTSMPGSTNTGYNEGRERYAKDLARTIAYMSKHDKLMVGHIYARKERGLENVMNKYVEPALGSFDA